MHRRDGVARAIPRTSESGVEITGCDAAEASDPEGRVQVFHAGTALRGDRLVTAGGRVLGVSALGDDIAEPAPAPTPLSS